MHSLPKIEIVTYFSVCITVIWHFIWNVYISGNALVKYFGSDENLVPGLPYLQRLRDVTDDEWMAWRAYITYAVPWYICHLCLTSIGRHLYVHSISLVHLTITIMFLTVFISFNFALLLLFSCLIFFCIKSFRSTLTIWFVGISLLILNSFDIFQIRDGLDYYESLLGEISFAWFILKALSFSLTNIKYKNKILMLIDFLGYIFYFPTFFFGPFIPFEDFYSGLRKDNYLNIDKYKRFFMDLLRFFTWFLLVEVALHFLYCNALNFHLNTIVIRNHWTLHGIGFCMSQFFYLKYLVYYGLAGTLAKFEGFETPPPPKCVNRIHLYSNMWRYFDRGYYLFTVKCIYKPICQNQSCSQPRKFLASLVSFCFVFIWHGQNFTVFYWSLFNFIGITIEAFGKYLSSLDIYCYFVMCLTPQNVRRIVGLISAPVWMLAVVSNYIFFAGHNYGFKLIKEFFKSDWKVILFTLFVGYSFCQVSHEVEHYEKNKHHSQLELKQNKSNKHE